MRVLGYNGGIDGYPSRFGTSHDAAAALVDGGLVVAACEEERLSRRKHTGEFPARAMEYCLRAGGIESAADVSLICYYHSLSQMFRREMLETNLPHMRPGTRAAFGAALSLMRGVNRLAGYSDQRSLRTFRKRTGVTPEPGRFRVVPHHVCHAASAFYPSPFEEALVLTMDAQGEAASTLLCTGRGNTLAPLKEIFAPNSLGYVYQCLTNYLGFETGDEYKVMGLAPYGDPARFRAFFEQLVRAGEDGSFAVDPNLLLWLIVRDALAPEGRLYPRPMTDALGPPRRSREAVEQRHADIAAALQEALERSVMRLLERARVETGLSDLCLAGGVALNCTLNGKIARSGLFDRVWVQPASHDAGTALGAALYGYHALLGGERRPSPRAPVFLGPDFGAAGVSRAILEHAPEVRCQRPAELYEAVARILAEGRIVGWFQGRGEWGPRALGHRSILADPRRATMRDLVNGAVKMREAFRPFAPSVLREHADAWFDLRGVGESPYMLFAVPVHESVRGRIPAVTHVDGSARVQTVRQEDSPRFHALLRAFHDLTGVPVLLNTSFNLNGEPIVSSPEDAMRCFLATKIDVLVMGDTVIEKRADVARRAREAAGQTAGGSAAASAPP